LLRFFVIFVRVLNAITVITRITSSAAQVPFHHPYKNIEKQKRGTDCVQSGEKFGTHFPKTKKTKKKEGKFVDWWQKNIRGVRDRYLAIFIAERLQLVERARPPR
jgi:hypothetical protein